MCWSPAAILGERQREHVLADNSNPSYGCCLCQFKMVFLRLIWIDRACLRGLRALQRPWACWLCCACSLSQLQPADCLHQLTAQRQWLHNPFHLYIIRHPEVQLWQQTCTTPVCVLSLLTQGFHRTLMTYMQTPGKSKCVTSHSLLSPRPHSLA